MPGREEQGLSSRLGREPLLSIFPALFPCWASGTWEPGLYQLDRSSQSTPCYPVQGLQPRNTSESLELIILNGSSSGSLYWVPHGDGPCARELSGHCSSLLLPESVVHFWS